MRRPPILTTALVQLGEAVNRTFVLPLVVFYPTSRCNSACISCDWWRSDGSGDLALHEIERFAASLPALGTRVVVFSGGEPLLRPDVFEAARLFLRQGVELHLLTSGILLERCAGEVARHFQRVVVSLDATTEESYARVRGVRALAVVERGVARLRRIAPAIPVSARATLHKLNFRDMPTLVDHAKAMGVDSISFLAADVSTTAFGRLVPPAIDTIALSGGMIEEFAAVVEETIATKADDVASGFISESPDKLRRLPQYYAALEGRAPFPSVSCDAPWISLVVEADGTVRPCFFHTPIGNVRHSSLEQLATEELPRFRAMLRPCSDAVCTRCVCSIRTSWRSAPWLA